MNPKQDEPEWTIVPGPQVVDEEAVLQFPQFELFDVEVGGHRVDREVVFVTSWQQAIDPAGTRFLTDLTVQICRIVSQLTHVAEHEKIVAR